MTTSCFSKIFAINSRSSQKMRRNFDIRRQRLALYKMLCMLLRWQVLYGVRADQCPFRVQRDWNPSRGGVHRSSGEGCNCLCRVSTFGNETPTGNTLSRSRRRSQADPLEGRHGTRMSWSLGDEVSPGRLSVQRSEPKQLYSCVIRIL